VTMTTLRPISSPAPAPTSWMSRFTRFGSSPPPNAYGARPAYSGYGPGVGTGPNGYGARTYQGFFP
jgi:hypothetical protein